MNSADPLRIFVTGANGNLATQFISLVQRSGLSGRVCQWYLSDLQSSPGISLGASDVFETIDLNDLEKARSIVREFRPQIVLHFGGLLSGACERDLGRAWQINATASLVLLEEATRLPGCIFFFPSTGATYGAGAADPLPEDAPQWPQNFYGVAKIAVERAGSYYRSSKSLDFRCLRFPMILSPMAPASAVSAYASHAFRCARENIPFTFPVSPSTGISTIYVKDVLSGLLRYLEAPRDGLSRAVYNVHSFSPSAQTIADAIVRRVPNFKFSFAPDPYIDGLLQGWPRVHLDASARHDWNWSPQFDLEATAADLLDVGPNPSGPQ